MTTFPASSGLPCHKVKVRGCPPDVLSRNQLGYLAVSLGNEAHYGEKLVTLLEWSAARHEHLIIGLTDLAYRHNYQLEGLSPLAAFRKAKRKGDEWLALHADILSAYRPRLLALHRWREWLKLPEFRLVQRCLATYYQDNILFQNSVETDVALFTRRYTRRSPEVDPVLVATMSRRFVMEECAVYVMIGRRYRANRLYPGQDINSLICLRHPHTPPELKGVENLTHVQLLLKHE